MGWVRLPRSSAPSSTSGALCRSNSTWRVVNHAFYTFSERINLRHSAGNAFRWDVAVGSNRSHCGRSQRGLGLDPSREYPPEIRLLQRLPVGKCGELISMMVMDHYVKVNTTRGKHSILMRFSDALAKIPQDLDLQVHRYHWIERTQVQAHRSVGKQ